MLKIYFLFFFLYINLCYKELAMKVDGFLPVLLKHTLTAVAEVLPI